MNLLVLAGCLAGAVVYFLGGWSGVHFTAIGFVAGIGFAAICIRCAERAERGERP